LVDGQRQNPQVDFAVAQPLQQRFRLVFVQHETQGRQRFAKFQHHARQQVRSNRGDQGHPELARERIGVVARHGDDLVAVVQHAACPHHDLPADLRELHVLRLALDQLDAEVVLEFLDLGGQRGLTHEGALGGLAEMSGVGEGHQILEILEIHTPGP
jgi:hypothetical protein